MSQLAKPLSNLERRQHPRFPIQQIEAVVISAHDVVSFCLLDICENGLSFCYNSADPEKWLQKECLLDFVGEKFSLENARVKIISDQRIEPENLPTPFQEGKIPSLRRCGVQFLLFSEEQQVAIRNYIKGITLNILQ